MKSRQQHLFVPGKTYAAKVKFTAKDGETIWAGYTKCAELWPNIIGHDITEEKFTTMFKEVEDTFIKPKKYAQHNYMGNMLPITNDWGDTIGYTARPDDYYEEPGY